MEASANDVEFATFVEDTLAKRQLVETVLDKRYTIYLHREGLIEVKINKKRQCKKNKYDNDDKNNVFEGNNIIYQ